MGGAAGPDSLCTAALHISGVERDVKFSVDLSVCFLAHNGSQLGQPVQRLAVPIAGGGRAACDSPWPVGGEGVVVSCCVAGVASPQHQQELEMVRLADAWKMPEMTVNERL